MILLTEVPAILTGLWWNTSFKVGKIQELSTQHVAKAETELMCHVDFLLFALTKCGFLHNWQGHVSGSSGNSPAYTDQCNGKFCHLSSIEVSGKSEPGATSFPSCN